MLHKLFTWVHRRGQHEGTGVGKGGVHPGNGDPAVLQRLAERFHCLSGEFRQLIQKQYAVVRQGYLSGTRNGAAAG